MAKTLVARIQEGQDLARAIRNLNSCYEKQIKRYDKRIELMLEECFIYFMTFTLSDKFISLKTQTITRKIKEALAQASQWILNADYGKTNGRLHYHALVSYRFQLDYTTILDIYKYGSVDIIPIKNKNQKALREYLLKHQSKQTSNKVMMSRRKKG